MSQGGRESERRNCTRKGRGSHELGLLEEQCAQDTMRLDHASSEPELWITFWLSRKTLNRQVNLPDPHFR